MREKVKKLIAFFKDWDNQSIYLKWMIAKTRPFAGSLTLILLFDALLSITGIGSAVVTKYIIDWATGGGMPFSAKGITVLIVLTSVGIAVGAAGSILTTFINERYAFSIRSKVYKSLLRSQWQKLSSFHSGDVVTRLTGDIDRVSGGISSIFPSVVYLLVRLLIAFGVLYHYDRFLALTAMMLGPVGVLLSLSFSGKLKKYQDELNKTESQYRSLMQETVENIQVIKSFVQEDLCDRRLLATRDERLRIIMRRNKLNTAMNLCIRMVFSAGYLAAFSWGIYRLSSGSITYGTLSVFLSLVSQVQGPIISLGNVIPQFIAVLASTGRILEIESIPEEVRSDATIKPNQQHIGLRLDRVFFGYGRDTVLHDVSLDIRPGDIMGVVGPSGSGKTTLVRLILSLVGPQSGSLRVYTDSGETENISSASRRFISYVPQGNTLISGSICDNLLMGDPGATEEKMWQALQIADCVSFVRELPDGLNTQLGENASGLSEGQAQRIAIARAVIKQAAILILDEATSALDAQTEERVLGGLRESGLLRTCVIITHRRSMLKFCTRALEIEGGRFAELTVPGALPAEGETLPE